MGVACRLEKMCQDIVIVCVTNQKSELRDKLKGLEISLMEVYF